MRARSDIVETGKTAPSAEDILINIVLADRSKLKSDLELKLKLALLNAEQNTVMTQKSGSLCHAHSQTHVSNLIRLAKIITFRLFAVYLQVDVAALDSRTKLHTYMPYEKTSNSGFFKHPASTKNCQAELANKQKPLPAEWLPLPSKCMV